MKSSEFVTAVVVFTIHVVGCARLPLLLSFEQQPNARLPRPPLDGVPHKLLRVVDHVVGGGVAQGPHVDIARGDAGQRRRDESLQPSPQTSVRPQRVGHNVPHRRATDTQRYPQAQHELIFERLVLALKQRADCPEKAGRGCDLCGNCVGVNKNSDTEELRRGGRGTAAVLGLRLRAVDGGRAVRDDDLKEHIMQTVLPYALPRYNPRRHVVREQLQPGCEDTCDGHRCVQSGRRRQGAENGLEELLDITAARKTGRRIDTKHMHEDKCRCRRHVATETHVWDKHVCHNSVLFVEQDELSRVLQGHPL
eukprot:PhM_4_TR15508/c0_g1_i1/m.48564